MKEFSTTELEGLGSYLSRLSDELQAQYELGKSASDTVVLDQSKVGRLSRMDAMQQQKMAESTLQNTRHRLAKVQAALIRFKENDYGYCEECGEAIAIARLKIQPEAEYCIKCQSSLEAG